MLMQGNVPSNNHFAGLDGFDATNRNRGGYNFGRRNSFSSGVDAKQTRMQSTKGFDGGRNAQFYEEEKEPYPLH